MNPKLIQVSTVLLVFCLATGAKAKTYLPHTTCERNFEKVGCYKDKSNDRALPDLLVNDRDTSSDANDGHILDWHKWEESIHSLACRCANATKQKGWKVFGLQFYGECWSGENGEANLNKHKEAAPDKCFHELVNNPPPCDKGSDEECVGKASTNYVYILKDVVSVGVDGGYSSWSKWTQCSKSCGGGTKTRERTCTKPPPEGNGKTCDHLGPAEETVQCNKQSCPDPCKKSLDVGIIIDGSGSVGKKDFQTATTFLAELVGHLIVSKQGSHVGVIVYNKQPTLHFNFAKSEYHTPSRLKAALKALKCPGGGTRTDLALEMASKNLFTAGGGDRTTASNVLIVLTDGKTNKGSKPYKNVLLPLQKKRVRTVAVGVGSKVDNKELLEIAAGNTEYVVHVNDFGKLRGSLQQILGESCQGAGDVDGGWNTWSKWTSCSKTCGGGVSVRERACTNPPPMGNGKKCQGPMEETGACAENPCPKPCTKALDLGVILDGSGSVKSSNFKKAKEFISSLITHFSVSKDGTHVGLITYSTYPKLEFGFKAEQEFVELKKRVMAVRYPGQWTRTDRALELAANQLFTEANGDRSNKPNVLIVFTDGKTNRGSKPYSQVLRLLQMRAIRTVAVGIGPGINLRELIQIAMNEPTNVVQVDDFDLLKPKLNMILDESCQGVNPPPPDKECHHGEALGLENKKIPDSGLSASSVWDINHGADRARLNTVRVGAKTGAWSARTNDKGQWLQIDLGKVAKVTKVLTQGRSDYNQWVTSYWISYSLNNGYYETYGDHGRQIFPGNADRNTVVIHQLETPIYTRYFRIHPQTWSGHISMRLELYGCKTGFVPPAPPQCMDSLGMQSGRIKDDSIQASTEWDSNHGADNARLHFQKVGSRRGAWSARHNNDEQWLQVDLGSTAKVRGVGIQGRMDSDQWVKSYTLATSYDGIFYYDYKLYNQITEFQGNVDRYTVSTEIIDPPIVAQYVRVKPLKWHGHVSMRVEFYGCTKGVVSPPAVPCTAALGMESGAIKNDHITASSQWDAYHGPARARLRIQKQGSHRGAWSAKVNDQGQWLQVNFDKWTKIMRLAIQGRADANQYVKKFQISYSVGGNLFEPYMNNKVFVANKDQHSIVGHELEHPFIAKAIRVHPTEWYGHISMRVEFYGCTSGFVPPSPPACMTALGLQSGKIKDASVSASTEWDSNHAARNARLHFQAGGGKAGAWSSRYNNVEQWLQVNLGAATKVHGVATQGRSDYKQWVTRYSLEYSYDGVFWESFQHGDALVGNTDQFTVVNHVLNPFIAHYVRVFPKAWYGHISMRMELYGCTEGIVAPKPPCAEPLGMGSGTIKNGQITASSQWDAYHGPARARLRIQKQGSHRGAWSAKVNDQGQWLQVTFNEWTKITRLATQGRADANQYVKSFTISYSLGNGHFEPYLNNKVFTANKDQKSIVSHILESPIIVKAIRVHPKEFYGHISTRVEFYGCISGFVPPSPPACMTALGLQSGKIKDASVSASTEWDSNHAARNARLHFQAGGGKAGAWSSRYNNVEQWLQVNLGAATKVHGVATQGRSDYKQWVTSYSLEYSYDGVFWEAFNHGKAFVGNTDQFTVVKHVVNSPSIAHYVRFIPKAWHGHISMRMELYGCTEGVVAPKPPCAEPLGMGSGAIKNGQITASSQWDAYHGPARARLRIQKQGSHRGAWSAKVNDQGQWLQITFNEWTKITRLATQGRADAKQYVKSFTISYSLGNGHFEPYLNNKVFKANKDQNSIVGHILESPIIVKAIRVHPKEFYGHISMRVDFYGCTSGFQLPNPLPCMSALGLGSSVSASSEWNSNYGPENAKLHFHRTGSRTGAWSAKSNNKLQWIRVEFSKVTKVTRVSIQGRQDHGQWVKKFKLSFSQDNALYEPYMVKGHVKEFAGNTDQFTVVSHALNPPIIARFVKVEPTEWHRHISLRLGFYGCTSGIVAPKPPCAKPLGMESGTIKNGQITASSQWDAYHGPARARLRIQKQGSHRGAWSAKVNDQGQWLQVTFNEWTKITRLATQGRADANQYVKSFTISYSLGNGHFEPYLNNKVFPANKDQKSIVVHILESPIIIKAIRVHPKEFHGHISMRVEFYGCTSGFQLPNPTPCMSALGLGSSVSASSEWDSNHGPENAKLHFHRTGSRTGAWSAKSNNKLQWIRVDFSKVAKVTRVSIQGRQDHGQWVKKFKLSFSQDNALYEPYMVKGHVKEFAGNTDQFTVVSHALNPPIIARFVKVEPTEWHGHISMRLGFYGCTSGFTFPPARECVDPLGLESGRIPDASIRASSEWDANHGAKRARLNAVAGGGLRGAWSSRHNNKEQWIEVDLGGYKAISRVALQGRQDSDQWVSSYKLAFSVYGAVFEDYTKIFTGNHDRNTIKVNVLNPPIMTARYVRIKPQTWHRHISMRMELYGCQGVTPPGSPCHHAMDLGIIMDRSGSVGAEGFEKSKDFVTGLVNRLQISPQGTRVGIIAYQASPVLVVPFANVGAQNPVAMSSVVGSIRYTKGGTRTDKALQMAASSLFSSSGGDRSSKHNVLIVMSDGKTNRGSAPYKTVLAPLLKNKVKVIAVGVGKGINNAELTEIANGEARNVIHVDNFNELLNNLKTVMRASCQPN